MRIEGRITYIKTMGINFTDNIAALSAVTATTTSSAFDFSKRSQITATFTAASISSGNGVFTVDVSNDGTNWVTGIAFQDATATASTTWVTSKTLNSNTSAGAKIPAGYRFYRIVVTRTTDGTYSATFEAAG